MNGPDREPGASGASSRLERGALVGLVLVAFATIALSGWCIAARFSYPFELSRMEGGFVDHARWAAEGRPLYAAPSAQFVPFLYTPLAHYAAGFLIHAGMDGFAATRAVSLIGIAGATLLGMWLVSRASSRRALPWLVPVLVCARYFEIDGYLDQARPDNLMALFCMAATFALALPSARLAVPLFVVSGVLAVFTKQSAMLFLGVLLAVHALARWRTSLLAGVLLLATVIPLFAWVDAGSHGWFRTYTLTLASHHSMSSAEIRSLWTRDLGIGLLLSALLIGVALVSEIARRGESIRARGPRELAWSAASGGALAGGVFSLASAMQPYAVRNVFVLFVLTSAVFLPLAFERFAARWNESRASTRIRTWSRLALGVLVLVGLRDPRPYLPTARDVADWRAFLATLARLGPPERTWVALHGAAWGGHAGDPFHVYYAALSDLVGGRFGGATGMETPRDLLDKIERQEYSAIVVGEVDQRLRDLVSSSYEPQPGGAAFSLPSLSGYRSGLHRIWVPKRAPDARDPRSPAGDPSKSGELH